MIEGSELRNLIRTLFSALLGFLLHYNCPIRASSKDRMDRYVYSQNRGVGHGTKFASVLNLWPHGEAVRVGFLSDINQELSYLTPSKERHSNLDQVTGVKDTSPINFMPRGTRQSAWTAAEAVEHGAPK